MSTVAAIAHVWLGAVWLGGVWFSLVNLHRRGPRVFADAAEFERVVAALTRGNRWLLLGVSAGMALTGGWLWASIAARPGPWTTLIVVKAACLAANVAVFGYVSWVVWPRRLFALADELPAIRRRQTALRVVSLLLLTASTALGVVAHGLRSEG